MNRYDSNFRTLAPMIRANGLQRACFARSGIWRHRLNGFGPEDDDAVVRQFDLSGLNEYWDIELSEPMPCKNFAHLLSIHFMNIKLNHGFTEEDMKDVGQKAIQFTYTMKYHILSALRAARAADEPWFIMNSEAPSNDKLDAKAWFGFVPSDVVIVPAEPPSDGIDLSKLRVKPRAAAEWLFTMPKRRHLVPPSLARHLRPIPSEPVIVSQRGLNTTERADVKRKPGPVPIVQARVQRDLRDALASGADIRSMKQEEMMARFRASADTCRKARKAVLAELGEVPNSD